MIRLSRTARRDVRSIASRFTEQTFSTELSHRFLLALRATCAELGSFPQLGRTTGSGQHLDSIRRIPITGFPKYVIFYRVMEADIRIDRVLHGAQDLSLISE